MKNRHCIKTYSNQTMAMVEDALSRPWRYHVTFRDIILPGTSPDWFPYDQNIEFNPLILNTRIPEIARPLEPPRPRTSGTRITPTGTLGLFGTASEVQAQFHCKSFYVKFTWNGCFNKASWKSGNCISTHRLIMAETISGIIY